MKIFSCTIHFNDTEDKLDGLLIAEYDCVPDGYEDDDIFFYGLSEEDIKHNIEHGQSAVDWEIKSYELYDEI